ncbi:hypothetical protein KQX64_03315 [Rhodopseudomonas palustris]|nr:hypothetical protein KQX64_03315 [Rhodopseudomonas palustris]
MITRTVSELTPVIQATHRDVENWVGRLDLATGFDRPGPGRARMFSKENAFELGMLAALVRGGAAPSTATLVAAKFAQDAKRNWRGTAFKNWLVFPAGDCSAGVHTDKIDVESKLIRDLGAITFSAINVRKLIDDIEALYRDP